MNKKILKLIIFPVMLAISAMLISGCGDVGNSDFEKEGANFLNKCKKGETDWLGGTMVLGKEKHELNGKTMEFCCMESQESSPRLLEDERVKTKTCMKEKLIGGSFITWAYNKDIDKMMKISEGYPKGEQSCFRYFNFDTGEQTGDEACMTIEY